jgi:hypothetical protein
MIDAIVKVASRRYEEHLWESAMLRIIAIVSLFALSACGSGASSVASLDGGRQEIGCADSYIVFNGAGTYTCQQFEKTTASSSGGAPFGGIFQRFNFYGTISGRDRTSVSLQVAKALANGYYTPNVDYDAAMRSFNDATKQAQDWSPVRTINNNRVVSFTAANQRFCFAFAALGGSSQSGSSRLMSLPGYGHFMRGTFCRGRPFTDTDIASLMVQVEVRDSLSAPLSATLQASLRPTSLNVPSAQVTSASAISPPPTNQQSTLDSNTLDRGVLSGTQQRVGFFYSINTDCSFIGYPTIHIKTPPAHGMLSVEQDTSYTFFERNDQRYRCNLNKSQGTLVYYKSDAGYFGPDTAVVETIWPTSSTRITTYNMSVK